MIFFTYLLYNCDIFYFRLYTLGLNPDVEKLYPEVQFPVPRNTPMISPLIKWDHSKSWSVPRWDERLGSSEIIFDVDVTSEESSEKYLLDHCIDGRYLYPACGYLLLVWQALAEMIHKNYESLPVVIEDVKIHRATILNKTAEMHILSSKQPPQKIRFHRGTMLEMVIVYEVLLFSVQKIHHLLLPKIESEFYYKIFFDFATGCEIYENFFGS
ncbi:fatty acid synthase [Trichonephila clavipes]|nr:fatty acid synthase [Trichonephila clavipes]